VIARSRPLIELGLAFVAMAGAAVSFVNARSIVAVAPIADGQPVTMSLVYNPQWLLLTLVLVTTAGVLEVVGVARLWRERSSSKL
jgi:hypothetical protein